MLLLQLINISIQSGLRAASRADTSEADGGGAGDDEIRRAAADNCADCDGLIIDYIFSAQQNSDKNKSFRRERASGKLCFRRAPPERRRLADSSKFGRACDEGRPMKTMTCCAAARARRSLFDDGADNN